MAAPLVYVLAGASAGWIAEQSVGAVKAVSDWLGGDEPDESGQPVIGTVTASTVAAASGALLAYYLASR